MDNQRGISKELFDKSGLESTPNNWHIWKRAFDLGVSKAKESDLLHNVSLRYSVSIVFTKNIPNGVETSLKVFITNAENKHEAMGKAIEYFDEEMREYTISNKLALEVNEG